MNDKKTIIDSHRCQCSVCADNELYATPNPRIAELEAQLRAAVEKYADAENWLVSEANEPMQTDWLWLRDNPIAMAQAALRPKQSAAK